MAYLHQGILPENLGFISYAWIKRYVHPLVGLMAPLSSILVFILNVSPLESIPTFRSTAPKHEFFVRAKWF